MKYFKKLVGERIYLSTMNLEDAEEYTKWLNDFNVTDYIGKSSSLVTLEGEKLWLDNTLKKSDYQFAIVRSEDDTLIGNCGFDSIDHIKRTATLGIFIGEEENRSLGYGTESLNLLLDYGFNYLNLHNIILFVFSFNERAIAAYKKVGFKEIGKRREAYFLNGKYYDIVSMDILSNEFKGSYIKNKNIQ